MTTKSTLKYRSEMDAIDSRDQIDLSDAVFFAKLQELRHEHKRALEMLEKVYKGKMMEKYGKQSIGAYEEDRDDSVVNQEEEEYYEYSEGYQCNSYDLAEMTKTDYSYFPRNFELEACGEFLTRSCECERGEIESDRKSIDEEKSIWGKEWKPKITIPQPFRMTIREELAPIRASYSQNFLHQILKDEKEREILERDKTRFRAKPAPPSTHLPLYEEMQKKNEERRRFVQEYAKEILKEKVKPFNITNSFIGHRHRRRCVSVEDLRMSNLENGKSQAVFKARPVPGYLKKERKGEIEVNGIRDGEGERDESGAEKREDETKKWWGPSNGQTLNQSTIRKAFQSKRRHQQQCQTNGWAFRPQITKKVPDFNALHEEFERSMRRAKMKGSRITIPEPFDLRVDGRPLRPRNHQDSVKFQRTVSRRSKSMSSLNWNGSIEGKRGNKNHAVRPNTTTVLREAAVKRQLQEMEKQGVKLLQQWQQKETEANKMRESMRAKLIDYDLAKETKERERTEQRKLAMQSSQELYGQFQRAIREKISDRESLLDRQNMLITKHSIERRYRRALESAGLKGYSVSTAAASIQKLLSEDEHAAAAVSAVVDQGPVDTTRTLSSPGSSSTGSKTSQKYSTSRSGSVATVTSKENSANGSGSERSSISEEEGSGASVIVQE